MKSEAMAPCSSGQMAAETVANSDETGVLRTVEEDHFVMYMVKITWNILRQILWRTVVYQEVN